MWSFIREESLVRGQVVSHGRAQGSGWARRSTPPRSSARGLFLEPHVEHVGKCGFYFSSIEFFILVLERLLVRMLTSLEGAHLSAFCVPIVSSVDSSNCACFYSWYSSDLEYYSISVPVSEYGILRSEIQPSSMLPPQMGS